MVNITCIFTVYFQEPFWVGVYERIFNGKLEAAKITFGSEPKDYEVYEYLNTNFNNIKFSLSKIECDIVKVKINPKRMKRIINKELIRVGTGTKALEALKLQYEQNKNEIKTYNRNKIHEDKKRKFELKQNKKKEKHKGH